MTNDEKEQSKLLTARILKDFIKHSQNLKKKNSGFLQPKKPSCSRTRLVIKRKRSHSETEEQEQEDQKANAPSTALQLPLKKRLYPRAAAVDKEETEMRTAWDSDKTPLKELPMEMRNLIESMGGTDIKLVIEKTLSKTDCSKHHDRLTIPKAQAESEFLNGVEKHMMDHTDGPVIQVSVIQPCFEESNMCFTQWKMRKSSTYVIRSGWNKACQKPENKLIAGVKVQVWSFRVHGDLCFAIVRVEGTAEPHTSSSSSSSSCSSSVED
ncbi:hypothetical protein FNV43_RR23164 [Rhamnella rubrinervis]|uniref:B3 domain-containing protein n=1 Tax=Rhamnella rubrinervis TaxID=2594499 RepID=A0A8K0E398_9ROSA|nr:hypothetical protein FNV43_RR23164 [Rhamnella rubrinervis]